MTKLARVCVGATSSRRPTAITNPRHDLTKCSTIIARVQVICRPRCLQRRHKTRLHPFLSDRSEWNDPPLSSARTRVYTFFPGEKKSPHPLSPSHRSRVNKFLGVFHSDLSETGTCSRRVLQKMLSRSFEPRLRIREASMHAGRVIIVRRSRKILRSRGISKNVDLLRITVIAKS